MNSRNKIVAVLTAVVVLVPVGYVVARKYVHVDLGLKVQADPLEDVEVVSEGSPNAAPPTRLLTLLGESTGRPWHVRLLQDWDPQLGGEPYVGNRKSLAELARVVEIPDSERVLGVATNALDPRSARRDGSLYVIWFKTPADTGTWLRQGERVFVGDDAEGGRTSYWAGSFAVFYSPVSGGHDWSAEVLSSVRELAGA